MSSDPFSKAIKHDMEKTSFIKFDGGKLRWDLMPEPALEEILKVLMSGAINYGDWNWLDNHEDVKWSRYLNALERHLKAFKQGRDFDIESGYPELAHLACNALFLISYFIDKRGIDDRRKK